MQPSTPSPLPPPQAFAFSLIPRLKIPTYFCRQTSLPFHLTLKPCLIPWEGFAWPSPQSLGNPASRARPRTALLHLCLHRWREIRGENVPGIEWLFKMCWTLLYVYLNCTKQKHFQEPGSRSRLNPSNPQYTQSEDWLKEHPINRRKMMVWGPLQWSQVSEHTYFTLFLSFAQVIY